MKLFFSSFWIIMILSFQQKNYRRQFAWKSMSKDIPQMSRFPVFKAFFHKHNELNTPSLSVHFLAITCKLYPGSDLFDHFHPRHSGPAIASPWTIVISSDDLVFRSHSYVLWSNLFSPQKWNKSPNIAYHTIDETKELSVMESITSWVSFLFIYFFVLSTSVCWLFNLFLSTWVKSKPGLSMQREREIKENVHHTRWGRVAGLLSKGRLHARLVLGAGRQ